MVLVLNCGSQSIKWKVFSEKNKVLAEGKREVLNSSDFDAVLAEEMQKIARSDLAITTIGHRVVHGGEKFREPVEITAENLAELEKLNDLAPLHNPYNILGIKACQKSFPEVKNIAFFDTEFFADLPAVAYTYALPAEYGFRRYGFQGTSHEYVAHNGAEKLKKPFNKLKIITCHLGGGASITAIKNGKAVDTSMGFTPLEGLVMMTRSGNIDAGIVLELAKKFGVEKASEILNKQSGVKGICGEIEMTSVLSKISSADEAEKQKNKLALNVFVYSIQKYIGSYFAILGRCDLLVFTGSIGSGSAKIRNMICKNLEILKKTKVLAIETNEELAIAQKIIKF